MVPRSMCKDDAEFLQLLRDEFAAKAMQMHGAMLSDMEIDGEEAWDEYVAKRAYKTADAMLKAREQ